MSDQYRIRKIRGKRLAERRELIIDSIALVVAVFIAWGVFDLLEAMFGKNN